MYKKGRKFTRDFKLEVVRLTEEENRSVASVARELDIHANQLSRWRKEYLEHENDSFLGTGHLHSKDEELRQLRRQVADVTEERDILKKAIASSQNTRNEIQVH